VRALLPGFPTSAKSNYGRGDWEMAGKLLPYHRFTDFVADWEEPTKWRKELKSLNYEYEKHDTHTDPLCIDAEALRVARY
jgi:hypothetical protein